MGLHLTGSSLTQLNNAYVRLPETTEQVVYAGKGSGASDSNDGLTPRSAKATISAAVTALGGNPGVIRLGYGTFTQALSGSNGISLPSGTVIEGLGRGMTTIAAEAVPTATGAMFSLANNANVTVRRLTVAGGTVSGGDVATVSPQFIATTGTWTTGRIRIEDVDVTGDWGEWLHVGSAALTPDIYVDRCTFTIRGTALLAASSAGSNAGGRLLVDRTRFLQYGMAGNNQYHAIYCYTNNDLIVRASDLGTNIGTGSAIQHYGAGLRPNRSEFDGCYFSNDSYYGVTISLSSTAIPASFKACTFACSTYHAQINSHATFEDCNFITSTAAVAQTGAGGSNTNVRIKMRHCYATTTNPIVVLAADGAVADVADCLFPNYSATQAVASLNGTPASTTILDRRNDKGGTLSDYIPPTTVGHGYGFDGGTHDIAVSANTATYTRFEVFQTVTINRIVVNIGTSSGNLDVGLYSDNAGAPGTRLVSSGSTASPGAARQAITVTATTLTPGIYWFGIAVDNGTITIRGNQNRGLTTRKPYTQASAFPLPSSATPVAGGINAMCFSAEAA